VSAIVVVSTVATSAGVVAVRPVTAAGPERRSRAYLPVRWQGADDPPFAVYLPVVVRNYALPASNEAIIEPGIGGEVGSPDGKVRVVFGPAAVTQTVIARYTPIDPPTLPPGNLGLGGPAFDVSAQTLGGTPVHEFPPLVTIIPGPPDVAVVTPTVRIYVNYTPEDTWGLDLREFFLYTRDGLGEEWTRSPSAVYQDRQQSIAEIDHLSEFVPMAPLAASFRMLAAAVNKRLALDPDDNLGHAYWPGVGEVRETPMAFRLAQETRQRFEDNQCHIDILITRDSGNQAFVTRSLRAESARNFGAEMFATLTFNALTGSPWGWEGDGGLQAWARNGNADDAALVNQFFVRIDEYTGRPYRWGSSHPVLPYSEFNDVAPHYAHIETLFLDHNYDWPVINTQFNLVVDAAYAALATRLGELGLTCGEGNQPPPIPAPPSSEVLQRLRDLGYQNYQRYGGDPVSFSTGNHVVQARLFRIPSRGGLDWDFTLTYNSQDGRDDLFGYGWSFPYNARTQRYSDDSVSVVLHDGRTYYYTWNGSGYDAPAGVFDSLERTGDGWRWIMSDETVLAFQETVGGLGILTEWLDRQGNALHFTHDLSGQNAWENGDPVPRPPLTEIRDDAGRVVAVQSNSESQITRLDLWDGRVYTFEYDADGNLTRIAGPQGALRRFDYDVRHRMTKEWDAEDILFLQNVYDDRDRVIEQIDASGTHSFFEYDPVNRVTTFTDNLGNQEVYHWDDLNRVTGEQDASGGQVTNVYDADYNLVAMTDANGHTTRYTYDDSGNVTARIDPLDGYSLYTSDMTRWAYDDHNQVISMTNALNYTWLYEYDADGNLIHTLAPDGSETWAAYNAWGQPTVITDALGHATRYVYDTYGNQINTIDPAGNVVTSTYDLAGREMSYTDANGHTVYFDYDDKDNITRITDPKGNDSTFEYDGNDLLTRSVDRRGGERLYRYDENLKLVAERDPEENWTYYGYDDLYRRVVMTDALGSVTRYGYDEAGRLLSVTDPLSGTTRYEYDDVGNQTAVIDPLGHRTGMVYDASSRLKVLVDAGGNRTEYCYDAEDQLIRTIGPRGEVTDYTYDPLGRLIAVKDPLGNVTEYEYDDVGNRIAEIDPLDHRTDYDYDVLGRVVAVARPEIPGGERPTTQYAYDSVGNTLVITSPRGFATTFTYDENDNVLAVTDPLGGEISYAYDPEDSPVTVTDANGHTVTTTYNLVGLPVQVQDAMGYTTTQKYDGVYNLAATTNALGKATTYEYDPLGRLLEETDPLDNATVYARDALGRVTAVTDANGHATGYDYDELGRLIDVTDALSGTTRYDYDEVGNLTTITDANGHVTTFAYNFLNQLKRETNPLDKSWWYAYDGAGRLVRRVDGMWQVTYYDYDSNDRLTAIRYGTTPPVMHPVTFTYDLEGNDTQMCDGLGCTTHAYDPLGRRTSTTDWLGRTITRAYDAVRNLTGLTYPNGYTITYAYNPNDWLTAFTDPHGDSSTFDHNPLGQVTQVQHPNGTRAELAHDDAGRLLDLVNRGPGGAVQSAYHYMLDAVGNRVQVAEERAPFDGLGANVVLTHTYEYDALDRLVRAATDDPATDTAYTFDAVGNRLSKTGTVLAPDPGVPELPVSPRPEATTYAYNEANQLTEVDDLDSTTALDYNDNGGRVRETEVLTDGTTLVTDYAYDREDRLVGATKTVGDTAGITVTMVATYTYDGYGRRALKTVTYPGSITPTQVITYLYDGLDIIGAQLAQGGTVTETYYYLAPSPVTGLRRPLEMERLPNPATGFVGDRHWYQSDGLDSVVALTDESGNLASPYLYDEYGGMLVGMTELQLFAYAMQDYDPETKSYHFYARYFESGRGVWLTQDDYRGTYSKPASLHRYSYVESNPISGIDQLGYCRRSDTQAPGVASHFYPDTEEPPDMTQWLLHEIVRNVYVTSRMYDLDYLLEQVTAMFFFYQQVRTGGSWDYKNSKLKAYADTGILICGKAYANDVPGNIVYGYMGLYVGFWKSLLCDAAAYAQVKPGATREDMFTVLKFNQEHPGLLSFLDDPFDQNAIKAGFGLFEQGLSEENLCRIVKSSTLRLPSGVLLDTFPEEYDPCPYCA
jgi:RHS repeat-associated protein